MRWWKYQTFVSIPPYLLCAKQQYLCPYFCRYLWRDIGWLGWAGWQVGGSGGAGSWCRQVELTPERDTTVQPLPAQTLPATTGFVQTCELDFSVTCEQDLSVMENCISLNLIAFGHSSARCLWLEFVYQTCGCAAVSAGLSLKLD